MKNRSKLIGYIIGIFLFICVIGGDTFAWYRKTIYNVNVVGVTKNLEDYITYSSGSVTQSVLTPTDDYTEGSSTTITLYKKDSPYDNIYGHIYIDINTMSVDLSKELRYTVVNNTTSAVVGEGLFYPYAEGASVPAAYNMDLSSTATTYTIYIWIDEDLHDSNLDSSSLDIDIRCSATLVELDTQLYGGALYISNMYSIIPRKTEHTDSTHSITYKYSSNVKLMNDRSASMNVNAYSGNIRYYGADPDNYVTFNNEMWRIIGVFEGRLKLVRSESIGSYPYDTSVYDVNNGYGVNQWGPSTHLLDDSAYDGADLMKLLNPGYNNNTDNICISEIAIGKNYVNCGENDSKDYDERTVNNSLYWNAGSGICYIGANSQISNCDFSTTGLTDNASKAMIDEATWNLGSNSKSEDVWDGRMTSSKLFEIETSNNSGIQCNLNSTTCSSDVVGTTTWVGKVGLISPSDYAYAAEGGKIADIDTCLTTSVGAVSVQGVQSWQNTYTECIENNWLLNNDNQWTTIPYGNVSTSSSIFYVNNLGGIDYKYASYANGIRPVVYLKPNVVIISGTGTSANPYQLVM